MWAGLNGFDPRNDLVLGGVRIGIGCMNLVTIISTCTWVPVTLMTAFAAVKGLVSSFSTYSRYIYHGLCIIIWEMGGLNLSLVRFPSSLKV